MTYYTGAIAPVPTGNRQAYADYAAAFWPIVQAHGATRMVDTWGIDVPHGKVTDFHRAVAATPDEAIAFSIITWPDRATADAAWAALQADAAMAALGPMPQDGARMIWGGFAPVFAAGDDSGAGHYQGFLLAVPAAKKDAYADLAALSWPMFARSGALGTVEGWGTDVPHGQSTDMYRATASTADEVPVFSWILWPDQATCTAAGQKMEAEMQGMEMPPMPFDGMRMMWGGFALLFDSAQA